MSNLKFKNGAMTITEVMSRIQNANDSKQVNDSINETNVDYNHIYEYEDLSFGHMCDINRELNPSHVNSIYKGIKGDGNDKNSQYYLGEFYVDIETKDILDGNHRYAAVQKLLGKGGNLSMPLRVIYKKRPEGMSVAEAVKSFNDKRKGWTSNNYAKQKSKEGDPAMTELKNFCLRHKFLTKIKKNITTKSVINEPLWRYGAIFTSGGSNVGSKAFKEGTYNHTPIQLERAETLYRQVERILESIKIEKSGTWFGEFAMAWIEFYNEYRDVIDKNLSRGLESFYSFISVYPVIQENMLVNQKGKNKEVLINALEECIKYEK